MKFAQNECFLEGALNLNGPLGPSRIRHIARIVSITHNSGGGVTLFEYADFSTSIVWKCNNEI